MKTKIHWKKFFIAMIVVFIAFIFIADVVVDAVSGKQLEWSKIFGFENLFWKILASIVGAFFYSSYQVEKKK